MALKMPKRVKYRKTQRGRIKGRATRGNTVVFGEYGLQSQGASWISAKQIEAGRIALSHFVGQDGRVFVRIFPHKSISAKPLETRMGKGKGEPDYWAAVVKPGTILYEIGDLSEEIAKEALLRAAHKMPVRCKFVKRRAKL